MIDPSSRDRSRDQTERDRIDMHGRAAQLVANVAVLLADAADAADDATGPEIVPTREGDATVYLDETGADVVLDGTTVHVRSDA